MVNVNINTASRVKDHPFHTTFVHSVVQDERFRQSLSTTPWRLRVITYTIIPIVISCIVYLLASPPVVGNNHGRSSSAIVISSSSTASPIVNITSEMVINEGGIRYVLTKEKGGDVLRYTAFEPSETASDEVSSSTTPLTVKRWAELLSSDDDGTHAKTLTSLITSTPFDAVFFETKGVSSSNASSKQFEFVIINAPGLYRFCRHGADRHSFSNQFQRCPDNNTAGCTFANLGGDATLVAPLSKDGVEMNAYSHLAAFLQGAGESQVRGLWRMVGEEYEKVVGKGGHGKTVWLSTCGTGVAWLHFRLDSYPKYYSYRPFAMET